ncbi:hypothetical protein GP486_006877, partial [Trichoglossum hirsutum]
VTVGGDKLEYSPPTATPKVGDTVMFMFMKNNHTVTQSTFDKPCVKMANGFDSQFMPNINNSQVPPPMATFSVTTEDPLWFYCRQKNGVNHCGSGMVFALNPSKDKTFDAFKTKAMQQNGTSTTTAAASAGTSSAVTLVANPPGSPTQAGSSVVTGSGQSGNGASCSCQCLCAVALFPPGAGLGSYGGFGGSHRSQHNRRDDLANSVL